MDLLGLPRLVLILLFVTGGVAAEGTTYYVNGDSGNDSNPGTQDKPFKTITKARDTIRAADKTSCKAGFAVIVEPTKRPYSYINGPLTFSSADSGTPSCPIKYSSSSSGKAHLTAGVELNWMKAISFVTDPVILGLLKESVRDQIIQIDLKKLGITDYGTLQSGQLGNCNNNKLDLYADPMLGMNMMLARYPNLDTEGKWQWLSAGKVTDKQRSFSFNTSSSLSNHILSWKNISTLWLHGYWTYDWADNYVKIDDINKDSMEFVASSTTPPVYGFVKNARYYALNILEELDTANEYYLDRGSGILYLFESTANILNGKGCVSVGETVVQFQDVSFVQFQDFTIDCARTTGINAQNVNNMTLLSLTITNSGDSGIAVTGYNNTLDSLSISNLGCGGIHLSGGEQKTLTRGNNVLQNSLITKWSNWKRTYNPGLSWGGVGNTYRHNTIHDGPHAGILGGGNDCVFEGNSITKLCYETSDSGGFYTGRSWIDRGNIIINNVFSDVYNTETTHLGSPSVQAIYLDDQMSGYTIVNNTFTNCHCAVFFGGGRRNIATSNLFRNCSLDVHIDDRGLTWQKEDCSPGGMFEQQLKSVNWQNPPWSIHYPEMKNIMEDHPCVPVYNKVTDNSYCQGKFIDISDEDIKNWLDTVENNKNIC